MNPPNVHAIILRETPDRTNRLSDHLLEQGIEWSAFVGINAEKWGLTTVHPYEVDHPGSGYIMIQKHVGLHLSHYWLWRKLYDQFLVSCEYDDYLSPMSDNGEHVFTVLEDDALFIDGWEERMDRATNDVPDDWDILMIGSCNCKGHDTEHMKGEVFRVRYPQCTHAMLVRERALMTMIETQEKSWAPIDLSLIINTYPKLNVYTVLPRIVDQFGQEISP